MPLPIWRPPRRSRRARGRGRESCHHCGTEGMQEEAATNGCCSATPGGFHGHEEVEDTPMTWDALELTPSMEIERDAGL